MKELDLQPLIEIAIALDTEARLLDEHEIDLVALGYGIEQATPADLARRFRKMADRERFTRYDLSIASGIATRLRERIDRGGDHPEVVELVCRLMEQALDISQRRSRLRRSGSDLEMLVLAAVKNLQEQSVDARILRLHPQGMAGWTEKEICEAVEADHEAIADALAAWRLSNGRTMVISIADTTTIDEIAQAMNRLRKTGHAYRSGSLLGVVRWTMEGVEKPKAAV